ncbi:M48 family metalloprotease [Caulobacter mirabilis]|uniref:Peptidase M48 n=1 Tax=Caulobacter mirabilis TaxID=69666 RepID=A0A2D2AYW0_9CAUL|nr:M48 family metalloprotease [Caulobacter mirabilis]ATQ43193.1 peptidase M48 [Caulobacter mirabilis]
MIRKTFRPFRTIGAAAALAAAIIGPLGTAWAQSSGAPGRAPTLLRDTEIEETLHRQADPIFAAAGLNPKDVRILLIGDNELNAFATQGQQMGLNTGLILETETPNQLKGVIAHETGHIAGAHPLRSGELMRAGLRPMLLTMGLGVLALLAGAPDAGAVLIGSSPQFGTLGALGYSRTQEGRADQAAVGYLEKTGQSAEGLVEFFDKFRYQEVFTEARRFPYFRSHPLSSERIEMLRNRVASQPHFKVKDTPEEIAEFQIMKAKIDAFLNPQIALTKYKETATDYPSRYARVIAYYQTKEPDKALKLLEALLSEQPNNPYLWELKGQILFEFNRIPEAEAPQRKSVELKPDAPLLRTNLGQTLINHEDPKKRDEGIAELKKVVLQEDDNAEAWRLLAMAYDRRGDEGLARLATAERYFSYGALNESRAFAIRARELLPRSGTDWVRATDIVMASNPSDQDLRELARDDSPRGR